MALINFAKFGTEIYGSCCEGEERKLLAIQFRITFPQINEKVLQFDDDGIHLLVLEPQLIRSIFRVLPDQTVTHQHRNRSCEWRLSDKATNFFPSNVVKLDNHVCTTHMGLSSRLYSSSSINGCVIAPMLRQEVIENGRSVSSNLLSHWSAVPSDLTMKNLRVGFKARSFFSSSRFIHLDALS